METLSTSIAPVLTKVEVKGNEISIGVSVDQFSQEFTFKEPENIYELNYILQQVASFVKQHLDKEEKPESVDYAIINGLLRNLDPHSSLLIPEIYSEFSSKTSGNFGGVGMMISISDGALTIISPIDNTPASRAGLRAKDHIVQINEESTINMSLSEAVKKLRGDEGTEVDIYIMRKSYSSPKKITIIRDIINVTSVKSFVFEEEKKRVGLLKISEFQENTIDEINSHLDQMDYDLKDFQGLIIDLRNNPGGLLDQAIKVSDRFLSEGVIVSTAGLVPDSTKSFNAHWFRSITNIPIIVLINNGSASASEIVAAALKKNNRAVVLGIQSFGKGSVQQVIPFAGGSALKLTTSKYLTPGNISIQSVGVSPHVAVIPYFISEEYLHVTIPKLDQAENSLDQNFAEWGDKAEPPEKTVFYLYKEDNKEETEDEEVVHKELEFKRLKEDFLVQTSVKILAENSKKGFESLLKTSLTHLEQEQKAQEQKLIEKFAASSIAIDWRLYPEATEGKIKSSAWIEIKTEKEGIWKKNNGDIPADSEIRLYVKAENISKTTISRLLAITECNDYIFDDRQYAFGKLDPEESKQWFIPFKLSKSSLSRSELVHFSFMDSLNRKIHQDSIVLNIIQKSWPEFLYEITTMDNGKHESEGNSDGIIQAEETITVKVDVTNKGEGESGALTVLLKNGEGKDVFLKKGRHSLKILQPGKTDTAYFQFLLKEPPKDKDLDFSLDIIDSVFSQKSLNQKFKIPIGQKDYSAVNMPPSIYLESSNLTSSMRKYKLSGSISDQKGVKDLYIFNDKKKVYYKNFLNNQNRSKVSFSVDLDLDKEDNSIIIISRDDDSVITQKSIFIRYTAFK
ncbi:PDZ domain-containing protein [bacterium]|nr:PDZ domain-containing protein [bacterium]